MASSSSTTTATTLVDSIFGAVGAGAVGGDSTTTRTLFDQTVQVPEAKEYPASAKKQRKQTVVTATTTAVSFSAANSRGKTIDNNNNKKKRKAPSGRVDSARNGTSNEGAVPNKKAKEFNGAATSTTSRTKTKGGSRDDDDDDDNDGSDSEAQRTIFVGNLPVSTTRRDLHRFVAAAMAAQSEHGAEWKIRSTRIRSVAAAGVKLPQHLAGRQNLVQRVCSNTQQLDATHKQSVSGYVVFSSMEAVDAALRTLQNLEIPDPAATTSSSSSTTACSATRHLRVDRVHKPTHDPSRTVFVGNLPYKADEETLRAHFEKLLGPQLPTKEKGKTTTTKKSADVVESVRVVRDKETSASKGFGYVLLVDSSTVAEALKVCQGKEYMNRQLRVQVCGKRTKGKQGATAPTAVKKEQLQNSVGALKRVLKRQLNGGGGSTTATSSADKNKKRRPRGEKKGGPKKVGAAVGADGRSKRAVADAKTNKRVKKLEKRVAKGMGKARK
jgi:nucleolar protein 12